MTNNIEDIYFKTTLRRETVIEQLESLLETAIEKRFQELYDMHANVIWRGYVETPLKRAVSINSRFPDLYKLAQYFPRKTAYGIAETEGNTYVRLNFWWNMLLDDMGVSENISYSSISKEEFVDEDLLEEYTPDLVHVFRKYGHMHFVERTHADSAFEIARQLLLSKMEDIANRVPNNETSRKLINLSKTISPKALNLKKSSLRPFTMEDFFVGMDPDVHYELPPQLAERAITSLILRKE